jgi:uncharacterized protein YjbI with pentapeptide repeats
MDRPDAVSDVADCDLKKPNRRAEAAQRRRFFEPRAVHRRRCRFGIFRHGFSDDHLAAATLTFESRRNIHGGAEVVEHVSRHDCDARSGVKSKVRKLGEIVANEEHVALLKSSLFFEEAPEWNAWRQQNPDIRPDLVEARLGEEDLAHADLHQAHMRGAVLTAAGLRYADLTSADLRDASLGDANLGSATLVDADLSGADLSGANLLGASLRGARLRGASLGYANISRADFEGADLTEADLKIANTVETKFANAILTGCRVYGISAWGLKLDGTTQQNLVITPEGEPEITVDNIEVAQFVYLLLYNQKIRAAIDAITSKAVLILGRFTHERKAVLDALRNELRKRDYLPILFDFDVPATRDITETVTLLARMSRFIIADLTDPSSIPKELEAIVPQLAVPVQPLIEGSSRPYAMFKDYWKYDWVLPAYRYENINSLLVTLPEKVVVPAEEKVKALAERRRMIEAELNRP